MLRNTLVLGMAFSGALALAPAPRSIPKPKPVRIAIETSMGRIEAELDSVHAPITVRNFLAYVDSGFFTKGRFHRTVFNDTKPVKIKVIQAGMDPSRRRQGFPPIELERTNVTGLLHKDGTLSMARSAAANSATSDFFICVGPQPELDFGGKRNPDGQGFAAFGKVTKGMDVVRAINAAPANGETLNPPIEITGIRRLH